MDEHEYAANMDLGRVFLEIMGRVVDEGFGFIAPELERWQDIEQVLLVRSSGQQAGDVDVAGKRNSNNGDTVVEIDGTYFDAFSLDERVSYFSSFH